MRISHYPVLVLPALAAASAILGSYLPGPNFGDAPAFSCYLVLAGFWFGLVVAFGAWRWGRRSWPAAATALCATWAGWEAAVNLAIHLDQLWLKQTALADTLTIYVSGFAAGGVGALATWCGVAAFCVEFRKPSLAWGIVSTGALFGMLLAFTSNYDNAAVLLVPWQAAVAATIGYGLRGEPGAAVETKAPSA